MLQWLITGYLAFFVVTAGADFAVENNNVEVVMKLNTIFVNNCQTYSRPALYYIKSIDYNIYFTVKWIFSWKTVKQDLKLNVP